MAESKREIIQEIKESLSSSDFMATLSYYGIRIVKGSILCPVHDDRHYGSCVISKDGRRAYCYACGESIDSISLVKQKENLEFVEAVEFLWCNILGRSMPQYNTTKNRPFVLNYKELAFIGLPKAGGDTIVMHSNTCYKRDNVPDKYTIDLDTCDDNGVCAMGMRVRTDSLYKMYETDPETVLYILSQKANDTLEYFFDLRSDVRNKHTSIGEMACKDRAFFTEMMVLLRQKIDYTKEICGKIEREKRFILKKAQ